MSCQCWKGTNGSPLRSLHYECDSRHTFTAGHFDKTPKPVGPRKGLFIPLQLVANAILFLVCAARVCLMQSHSNGQRASRCLTLPFPLCRTRHRRAAAASFGSESPQGSAFHCSNYGFGVGCIVWISGTPFLRSPASKTITILLLAWHPCPCRSRRGDTLQSF